MVSSPVEGGLARDLRAMFQGQVKFYKPDTGWGFIRPSTGGDDIFVHVYDLAHSRVIDPLQEHQRVGYDVREAGERKPGKLKAVNIRVMADQNS
jgi:CspA family cold shock protein